MSRVDSVEIAIRKAGDRSAGCILSSDAFFPFPDSIEAAARAGVVAIVQPVDRGATMKSSPLATCIAFRWSSPVQGTSSISTILDKIVATKRTEVAHAREQVPLGEVQRLAERAPAPRDFLQAISGAPPIRLIAEVKKASLPKASFARTLIQ